MKLLPILLLALIPVPAQAITWQEFWEPFRTERVYIRERPVYRRYVPMCTERVWHEEYVPGNYWRQGYVRTWSEIITVPCDPY
jgi:hypothetical protein